jgi:hypothetical protein
VGVETLASRRTPSPIFPCEGEGAPPDSLFRLPNPDESLIADL